MKQPWTWITQLHDSTKKNSITYYIIAIYLSCGNAAFSSSDSNYQEWNVSNNMQPWWSFLTIILIPCLKIKSPNLGNPWPFHQRVPNLWMSCRLGPWQGTRIVAAAITAGRHVILKCKINHLYSWNYTHITSILWRTSKAKCYPTCPISNWLCTDLRVRKALDSYHFYFLQL